MEVQDIAQYLQPITASTDESEPELAFIESSVIDWAQEDSASAELSMNASSANSIDYSVDDDIGMGGYYSDDSYSSPASSSEDLDRIEELATKISQLRYISLQGGKWYARPGGKYCGSYDDPITAAKVADVGRRILYINPTNENFPGERFNLRNMVNKSQAETIRSNLGTSSIRDPGRVAPIIF